MREVTIRSAIIWAACVGSTMLPARGDDVATTNPSADLNRRVAELEKRVGALEASNHSINQQQTGNREKLNSTTTQATNEQKDKDDTAAWKVAAEQYRKSTLEALERSIAKAKAGKLEDDFDKKMLADNEAEKAELLAASWRTVKMWLYFNNLNIGNMGYLGEIHVLQVIDDTTVLAHTTARNYGGDLVESKETIWISGIDTKEMIDDHVYDISKYPLKVSGVQRYESAMAGVKSIHRLDVVKLPPITDAEKNENK